MSKPTVIKLHNTFFRLSDGFEGTLSEALRELAVYLETPSQPLPKQKYFTPNDGDGFMSFLEVCDNGGKFSGQFSIDKLIGGNITLTTPEAGKWVQVPVKL